MASAPRLRVSKTLAREWLLFWLLIGPNLLLFGIFTYWPLVYNAYLSFVSWDFVRPSKRWVGLANYASVLGDDQFQTILANTIVFTAASVMMTMLLGLGLALLLNQPLRYRNTARAVLFAPTILSGAAVAIVWTYIFDPRYGLLNEFFRLVGAHSPSWLSDPHWAMPALIIVYVWKNLGYAVVIYLAGLQSIDRSLYEAATVDGAGAGDRFWHITLPGLSPVSFFLSVTSILSCFQAFDLIRVMTGGGPINATNTLVFHLYELGFVSFNAGEAGVVSLVLFLIMLVLTIFQVRMVEQRVHYS
ncbi:sugar ABC transporter permease [Chloroflexia bacterium SDU3-3]|nr:sugar ABC transporter permease [Chloroflexia bacterium SDU3-3]